MFIGLTEKCLYENETIYNIYVLPFFMKVLTSKYFQFNCQ